MKKEFLVGLIAAAAATGAMAQSAAALQICSGGAAGNGVQVTGTAGTNFVIVNFTPKCSTNVVLYGQDNTTYYSVAGGSTKGQTIFIGSSAGGGVKSNGPGTGTGGAVITADISGTTGIGAATLISS